MCVSNNWYFEWSNFWEFLEENYNDTIGRLYIYIYKQKRMKHL